MNEKIVKALGSVAAVAAIVMYVSYIPQIIGQSLSFFSKP